MEKNSDYARMEFLKNYKKYYGSYMLEDFNLGRHYLIEGAVNIWFVFKKEHFKSFKYQFPGFIEAHPEYEGEGDSINTKMLAKAVNYGCKFIVFAQKEDAYYYADPKELLLFCIENNLKRSQDISHTYKERGGNRVDLQEETYSFPLKFLKKWSWNHNLSTFMEDENEARS